MPQPAGSPVMPPPSPTLSASQLATLAELGEERTADVGDVLYRVGDRDYPFIAILEGEVAILDAAGNEIVRHGASGFLGELNLLSGQTVFVTAVVTQPLRYIAVDREVLRSLLYEDGPLSDLVLSAFIARREALQRVQGLGLEIVGPHSSKATMRMLDFARSNRLPFTWRDPERADDPAAAALVAGPRRGEPAAGQAARRRRAPRPVDRPGLPRAGDRPRARAAGGGRPARGRRRSRRTRRRRLRRFRGPRHAGRRQHRARRPGRRVAAGSRTTSGSRRGSAASELTSRAVTQARKFDARLATPYRAVSLEPGDGRHIVRLEEDHEIAARAVADRHRRAVPAPAGRRPRPVRGHQRLLRRRTARGAALRRRARGRRRRRELGRPGRRLARSRRRAGDPAPPPSRSARDDVGLPRARARALRRGGARPQRDRRAPRRRTGSSRRSRCKSGERLPFSFLFLFLGALPCTEWLDDVVARDDHGFILTGAAAGADNLLETTVPGVFAAGDVRSGSTKRCATAVGEGAWAVQLVHAHLAAR